MKKMLLTVVSLFLISGSALASWQINWAPTPVQTLNTSSVVYYPPTYYNPYLTSPYSNPYYPYYRRPIVNPAPPTNINSCPLQASYYDANGNWVAPKRVCPSSAPQVNIHVGG